MSLLKATYNIINDTVLLENPTGKLSIRAADVLDLKETVKEAINAKYPPMPDIAEAKKVFPGTPAVETKKYPHYFKELPAGTTHVDIYLLLGLFEVSDAGIAHAIKKLLCPGQRHQKSELQDITEARDTLNRVIEIYKLRHGIEG